LQDEDNPSVNTLTLANFDIITQKQGRTQEVF